MNGKPYKFGAQKRAEFLENLRQGMRRGAAAEAVGVTRDTTRNAYNTDPEFAAAVEQAEMDANETVEDALYQASISGNVTAIQVWLYNRMPDRWADKRNVKMEHSGPEGGPVRIKGDFDFSGFSAVFRDMATGGSPEPGIVDRDGPDE